MKYPEEFVAFLVHFHATRDYFECHEILEEYWKETDPKNRQSPWVGLILLAVSCYHHRRENFSGAERTLLKSIQILSLESTQVHLNCLGLDSIRLNEMVLKQLEVIQHEEPYNSMKLPISDDLLDACKIYSTQNGFEWFSQENSPIENTIIHRHHTRDRSDVIQERLRQKKIKGRNI
ncbi:DUF309 domain-containing protein [Peribacillus alkalitolerans]|uniref:DUF309 domain-containing protein n=1 Tax=Peribacillus alkalitolerans TaxID=1550385 RepID=UPI0013CF49C3|nr:DUF309 domain-containing protein [Peribacillus alkalitolerans]